jgi:hypothetical protein
MPPPCIKILRTAPRLYCKQLQNYAASKDDAVESEGRIRRDEERKKRHRHRLKNKIQSAVANVLPAGVLARQHRNMAEPGTRSSSAARKTRCPRPAKVVTVVR